MAQLINEAKRLQKLAGLINESEYQQQVDALNEAETIKVGQAYIYEHPKAGPVKVKALGVSSYGDDYFTVEALEDKGEVKKGNQYNAEIKNLSTSQVNESEYQSLEEKMSYDDFEQMIKPFLDLAKSKGWVWNSSGDSWYDVDSPGVALYHRTPLPTEETSIFKGKETIPGDIKGLDHVPNINYRQPLEDKSADVIMQPAYDEYNGAAYFQSKDKAILDAIKAALANNMDVAKDVTETSTQIVKQYSDGEGKGKPIFKPAKYYFLVLKILKKKEAQPQKESLNIDAVVNEALAKFRKTGK